MSLVEPKPRYWFAQAKADALPFVQDLRSLDVWFPEFFKATIRDIEA